MKRLPAWSARTLRLYGLTLLAGTLALLPASAETHDPSRNIDAALVVGHRESEQMPVANFLAAERRFVADHQRAPDTSLRFVIIPRDATVPISSIALSLVDDAATPSFAPVPVPLADDGSFVLPAMTAPLSPTAVVRSNLPAHSLHWRPLVLRANQPQDVRRLGDLRLECEVKEAGALNRPDLPFLLRVFRGSNVAACASDDQHFFIAPAALSGVTLMNGGRSLDISPDRIAESSGGSVLPRTYHLFEDGWEPRAYAPPLEDQSWPDDTTVQLHFAAPAASASAR